MASVRERRGDWRDEASRRTTVTGPKPFAVFIGKAQLPGPRHLAHGAPPLLIPISGLYG